jgi:hypothetical protein
MNDNNSILIEIIYTFEDRPQLIDEKRYLLSLNKNQFLKEIFDSFEKKDCKSLIKISTLQTIMIKDHYIHWLTKTNGKIYFEKSADLKMYKWKMNYIKERFH